LGFCDYSMETKIFDPADGFGALIDLSEITDATLVKRDDRWWMFAAGQLKGQSTTNLFSASLPVKAPLAATGWVLTPDEKDPKKIAKLAGHELSGPWDLKGGRHCPAYVKGWDPHLGVWVERIYYAGAAQNLWGPYTIGYLEWNGSAWVDQVEPAFVACEPWERGSVYEPNVIYADGKWKIWYVAGSNQDNYIIHGFAESNDGRSGWSKHQIFAPPEAKIFDFCVVKTLDGYEAVFTKISFGSDPAPESIGLWWCHAERPYGDILLWSEPIQIMTAEDKGWHAAPWKPSFQYDEKDLNQLVVFFNGSYNRNDGSPFPYTFTMGCLEIEKPGRNWSNPANGQAGE